MVGGSDNKLLKKFSRIKFTNSLNYYKKKLNIFKNYKSIN